jgi:hypothetical protein
LASTSDDRTIRLWDVKTHQPLGDPLIGHTNWVYSVAFSPDGSTLASASGDDTIRLWDVSLESWKSYACQVAGRNLTKQEWDEFIGADRPCHRTCPAFPPGDGAPADAP